MGPAVSSTDLDRLSALEERAWRGLARAPGCLVKRLDAQLETQHGLPLSSYEVLVRLERAAEGRLRMHDIAAAVLLSRSGLTRLIDRLEREGLVERCACERDARGAYAAITEAGRAKVREARDTHLAAVRSLFLDRFSADELELLAPLLERLTPPDGCCAET